MKINYVSNLPLNQISGGWSGINFRIHQELNKYFSVNYCGPINPQSDLIEKGISKLKRLVGSQGTFHFFSEARLAKIGALVENGCPNDHYSFYFGQTPWIKCHNRGPYGTYIDAAFPTYIDIYADRTKFLKKDLLRIQNQEEKWLQGAKHIFMGSQWAWDEMVKHYDLSENQKVLVWVGGNIDIPDKDYYAGGKNLLFISLDFEKKGGYVAVEVFNKLKAIYNDVTLTIIGQSPPDNILTIEGVNYAGLLRKHVKEDYEKFIDLLKNAFLLIHPTKMDTMGAVIIEAGYFGCPTIASNMFGIPELLKHQQTGYTIDDPNDQDSIIKHIVHLISNKAEYTAMRANVRRHTLNKLTYNVIGSKLKSQIEL